MRWYEGVRVQVCAVMRVIREMWCYENIYIYRRYEKVSVCAGMRGLLMYLY